MPTFQNGLTLGVLDLGQGVVVLYRIQCSIVALLETSVHVQSHSPHREPRSQSAGLPPRNSAEGYGLVKNMMMMT